MAWSKHGFRPIRARVIYMLFYNIYSIILCIFEFVLLRSGQLEIIRKTNGFLLINDPLTGCNYRRTQAADDFACSYHIFGS
jgi:hypothetical protein